MFSLVFIVGGKTGYNAFCIRTFKLSIRTHVADCVQQVLFSRLYNILDYISI